MSGDTGGATSQHAAQSKILRGALKHLDPSASDHPNPPDADGARPKVSIIIPYYGVEAYIEECLDSVIAQDYDNIEIILVDDASTDGSFQIARRFAAADPRVRILAHACNRGSGPTRDTGVRHATGAWFTFLDPDDFFATPSAVSTLVAAARRTGCAVVVGSCQQLLPDGSIEDFDRRFDRDLGGRPGEVCSGHAAYLGTMCAPGYGYMPMRPWGSLIDRSYYVALSLEFRGGEHQDLNHTPFLYHQSGGVFYAPEIVVTYRQRAGSISNKPWSAEKLRRYVTLWHQLRENIERFGLDDHRGDAAFKLAEHLVWKIEQSGLLDLSRDAVLPVLEAILRDAGNVLNRHLFYNAMDIIRRFCEGASFDSAWHRRLLGAVPADVLLDYYRDRLGMAARAGSTAGPASLIAPTPLVTDHRSAPADGHLAEALFVLDRALARVAELQETAWATASAQQSQTRETDMHMAALQRRAAESEAAQNVRSVRERQLQQALRQLQASYDAIVRSTSWRMTDPLRRMADRFPRLRGYALAARVRGVRLLRSTRRHLRR